MKSPKNIPASVRQRLLNQAKESQRPFAELLHYYAMERFLYRLSRSVHVNDFILKGALMLRVWRSPELRPTMDIDMLGRTSAAETRIITQIREIMRVEVEPDGIFFDPDSIHSEQITEAAEYEGLRVRFRGELDSAKVSMQIDIGFGDIVYPGPEVSDFPTLLAFPVPRLLCYSRESAIAEKFEAMVRFGMWNSRMKDFYDIWLLARHFDFDGVKLAEAIRLTFQQRGVLIPSETEAFGNAFIDAKQVQWSAFRKRLCQEETPACFRDVVTVVKDFLSPLVTFLSQGMPEILHWPASGPWSCP